MCKWSYQITCHLALTKLRGPSVIGYRGHLVRPKCNLHLAMETMMSCILKDNQTLSEYTFEKLAVISKLQLTVKPTYLINLIMRGSKDDQIRFSIETANIKANRPNSVNTRAKPNKQLSPIDIEILN